MIYLRKIAQGVVLSLVVVFILFCLNRDELVGQFFLYETLPFYNIDTKMKSVFAVTVNPVKMDMADVVRKEEDAPPDETEKVPVFHIEMEEREKNPRIIGLEDVIYQPEADSENVDNHFHYENITIDNLDKLRSIDYLKNNFYIVDKRTDLLSDYFNVDEFLSQDLSVVKENEKPKVLIFHTHSTELYKDSKDASEGVVGLGDELVKILDEKYGIQAMHNTTHYDIVNGKSQIMGAYERMEPDIRKILRDNPSIEIAIDLHRDGVASTTHLVKEVNGKPTAQIMFFNGLSQLKENGVLSPIVSLPNPNLPTNLAFSFQMQLASNSMFPGFSRKVYLNAYRYSLHMLPKSLLVEVGAQTNTKEEAFNAMEPLADILASVIWR